MSELPSQKPETVGSHLLGKSSTTEALTLGVVTGAPMGVLVGIGAGTLLGARAGVHFGTEAAVGFSSAASGVYLSFASEKRAEAYQEAGKPVRAFVESLRSSLEVGVGFAVYPAMLGYIIDGPNGAMIGAASVGTAGFLINDALRLRAIPRALASAYRRIRS